MSQVEFIADDLVSVTKLVKSRGKFVEKEKVVLAWGDRIEVVEHVKSGSKIIKTRVRVFSRTGRSWFGEARGKLKTQPKGVLQFSMIDVQQGDGMVLETPEGKVILIDGGDNKLFARYVAARYQGTTDKKPLEVDAMIVTHGDADHFAGLAEIENTEKHQEARKRLFISPKRIFHNGLVKGPSKLKPDKIFGQTIKVGEERYAVDLVDDLLSVPEARLNRPFKSWIGALKHWAQRGPIVFRQLAFGDDDAFDFLNNESISVRVLGPFAKTLTHKGKRIKALPLLRTPKKTVDIHLSEGPESSRSFSASHTINGHSVALQLCYGNVRFFLTGDLNQESMAILRKKTTNRELESEIVKAPHHGSADFDMRALKAMAPVVSIVSSGDESSRKEHIHPRATLMGALGKVSRGDTAIVLCTELAAFFELRGTSLSDSGKRYFGFERTNFGIIQIRTDGKRVLVFTHSGKAGMKEAYCFTVDKNHKVKFTDFKKG